MRIQLILKLIVLNISIQNQSSYLRSNIHFGISKLYNITIDTFNRQSSSTRIAVEVNVLCVVKMMNAGSICTQFKPKKKRYKCVLTVITCKLIYVMRIAECLKHKIGKAHSLSGVMHCEILSHITIGCYIKMIPLQSMLIGYSVFKSNIDIVLWITMSVYSTWQYYKLVKHLNNINRVIYENLSLFYYVQINMLSSQTEYRQKTFYRFYKFDFPGSNIRQYMFRRCNIRPI